MDIEEIENNYSIEIGKANEFFLTGLKNKNTKNLEKLYKDKLIFARERYYSNVRRFLKEQKKIKKIKKVQKPKENNKKNNYDYKPTYKDKIIYKLKILKFQLKIAFRQFRDKKLISDLHFQSRKIRIKSKNLFLQGKRFISYKYNIILDKTKINIEKIKTYSKENYIKIKKVINEYKAKILNLIRKKKEENKENTSNSS